jgi:hypothetical protein
MKHSMYIFMSPWDIPESFFWDIPTKRDAHGHVLQTVKKPAFISKHRTSEESVAQGWVVCVRKTSIDVPPPKQIT